MEYHDPSGVFPLISEQLSTRLPLRNLHWKSPNRPLRSINSLHVDLVPSKETVTEDLKPPPGIAQGRSESADPSQRRDSSSSNAPEDSKSAVRGRRHQIPGLHQTPYLKLYLLRCDDTDTYKNASRKFLREWVRTNTPPNQKSGSSGSQENHDAFEWMIVHVVLPDTPAASQPRASGSGGGSGPNSEKSSTSRWTSRGSNTILEKIRSDFNVSSKSAPDRVTQLRVPKEAIPPERMPHVSGPAAPSYIESPQEQEHAWNDVIAKFKTLILLSFDQRVTQYEEDIREKEAQRVLPGWNFCTFFVLKEGLARGFESVGLVEDALVLYDELQVGLDTILKDENENIANQSSSFTTFTEDMRALATKTVDLPSDDTDISDEQRSDSPTMFFDDRPINSRRKPYRELILENKISVFDFRCYLFARQMALLLRLGNARSFRSQLASSGDAANARARGELQRSVSAPAKPPSDKADTTEDLLSLADLCQRAVSFITSTARVLRTDLSNGYVR